MEQTKTLQRTCFDKGVNEQFRRSGINQKNNGNDKWNYKGPGVRGNSLQVHIRMFHEAFTQSPFRWTSSTHAHAHTHTCKHKGNRRKQKTKTKKRNTPEETHEARKKSGEVVEKGKLPGRPKGENEKDRNRLRQNGKGESSPKDEKTSRTTVRAGTPAELSPNLVQSLSLSFSFVNTTPAKKKKDRFWCFLRLCHPLSFCTPSLSVLP